MIRNVVDVLVGNLAFLVYDEERSLGNPVLLAVGAKLPGYFAFWLKVAQEIVRQSAKTLGPRGVARHTVNRNTQDLGIIAFEAFEVSLVRRHLRGSYRGPGERIKRQDDVLFAPKIR